MSFSPLFSAEVDFMKDFVISLAVGWAVGLLYAALRVKSPAPPLVALVGLLGMVLGEAAYAWITAFVHKH